MEAITTTEASQVPVPVEPQRVDLGLVQAQDVTSLVNTASSVATELAKIIDEKNLSISLGGSEPHVKNPGWTTLAVMLGLVPQTESTERLDDGAFTATVKLVRLSDGVVIGRGMSRCGGASEPNWMERGVDEDGNAIPVPDYARESMATTRATSKACKNAFNWVMVLAGYSATPAEEMEGLGRVTEAESQPRTKASRPKGTKGGKIALENAKDMKAKYASEKCPLGCPHPIVVGDRVAYWHDKKTGKGQTAHYACWLAAMEKREGADANAEVAEADVTPVNEADDGLPF